MDITVDAATVTLARHSILGDQSVFRHPSHTGDAPFVVSFKRRAGVSGAADRIDIRITRGKVDTAGLPLPKNLIGEISLYIPDGYTDTEVNEVTGVIEGIANATVLNTFGSTQAIPYE